MIKSGLHQTLLDRKMKISATSKKTLKICLFGLITISLGACGGGGSDGKDVALPDPPAKPEQSFYLHEVAPVRPLALSPAHDRLFVVNIPGNQLEIFALTGGRVIHKQSLPVGLGPVAVAVRSATEVWVVNHLSDSISIIDLSGDQAEIKRTLWVGDEPRDIVFAGPDDELAFITTARRGQNHVHDPAFTIPSIGRASVWVFDGNDLGQDAGGSPLKVINLFGNTPRGLARSPDGRLVYASIFHSGNHTTILPADNLPKPEPTTDIDGNPAPDTGLIVRYDGGAWRDAQGKDWSNRVSFNLPDYDVFAIDAMSSTLDIVDHWSGVGTTLFNLAVNPASGIIYASNLEALNEQRFEGFGDRSTTLRGHFIENRITVIDGSTVSPRHINHHLNYSQALGTPEENAASLATPLEMAISSNGETLYLAAFGSSKIGIFSTRELEDDTFAPSPASHIELPGGGISGVVLDEGKNLLFTLSRFDNALVSVDLKDRRIVDRQLLFNPEPDYVQRGRRFLYDARLSSSRGDSSCSACHIFGDVDLLAWDLGNPEDRSLLNPNSYVDHPGLSVEVRRPIFHPLKGPMTTQSLRGLANNGPLHWRGDKTGINGPDNETRELAAFKEFNGTFVKLLAREDLLPDADMTAFGKFILAMKYPPNPYRILDNSLTSAQLAGQKTFFSKMTTGGTLECNVCHVLDVSKGHFGTTGLMVNDGPDFSQDMKVPHLRNLYTKVGMFGMGPRGNRNTPFMGDQIAGFGFTNDGAFDTLDSFFSISVFKFDTDLEREQVVDFMLAFDSDLAPVVGQQVTISQDSSLGEIDRVDLLMDRAQVRSPRSECELVLHGRIEGIPLNLLLRDNGFFSGQGPNSGEFSLDQIMSMLQLKDNIATFTCVPPGMGELLAFRNR